MTESEKIYRLLASIDRRLSRLERQAEADNAREVDTAAACRILGKSAGAVNKMVQRGKRKRVRHSQQAAASMTVEAKSEAAMNLEVAISALGAQQPAQAGEHGIVWDNQVTFKVTVTNKAAGDYNRYVLVPLFIVKTDSAGNTRDCLVTWEQASLNLKPGESKDLQFTFDDLDYGTYALNVYARNNEPDDGDLASKLTCLEKPGESKYYDLQRPAQRPQGRERAAEVQVERVE